MTSPRELAVASWNIHKGVGTDRRRDLARTSAVIAEIGADILALQEVDTRYGTRSGLLDLERLRHDLGLIPVGLQTAGPAHGWHGNLLMVRNALVQEVHRLVLPGFEPRGAMVTDIEIEGQPLRIVNAHLGLLGSSRLAQARALIEKVAGLEARPTLLMGDLNEWRRGGASLKLLGRHFTLAPPRPSFPSRRPILALDRMMTIEAALSDVAIHDSALARRASDHLPLTARLRLAGTGPA
ncbi:EEP domain-containing protein [bacterium]|nr:EEP domain-containing protein [bacterium]